jgi:hypothetical protein
VEEEVIEEQNNSRDQQQVDKAFSAAANQAKKPEHSQDNNSSPDERVKVKCYKHACASFRVVGEAEAEIICSASASYIVLPCHHERSDEQEGERVTIP